MKRKEWITAGAVVLALLVLALSSEANRGSALGRGAGDKMGRTAAGEMGQGAGGGPGQGIDGGPGQGSEGGTGQGTGRTGQAAAGGTGRGSQARTESGPETGSMQEGQERSGPALDERQKDGMDRLAEAMKSGDKVKAARILLEDEAVFRQIFYETMESVRYLYTEGGLRLELDGEGLVLTAGGACFYGTFRGGKPNGNCTALQALELDKPRYDFAEGQWKDGSLDGSGSLGYRYFDGAPEGEAWEVKKEGQFVRDQMDGEIIYTISAQSGEAGIWKMDVKKGVTQLDGRWKQTPGQDTYQLAAQNDTARAYVLTPEEAAEARWVNLLVWEIP